MHTPTPTLNSNEKQFPTSSPEIRAAGGLYAMRRANGDWFALEDEGLLRVPVFRTSGEAMRARTRNFGMMLFKPALLDGRALDALAPSGPEGATYFWLVDNPSAKLNRGRRVGHAQLASLVHDAAGGQRPR